MTLTQQNARRSASDAALDGPNAWSARLKKHSLAGAVAAGPAVNAAPWSGAGGFGEWLADVVLRCCCSPTDAIGQPTAGTKETKPTKTVSKTAKQQRASASSASVAERVNALQQLHNAVQVLAALPLNDDANHHSKHIVAKTVESSLSESSSLAEPPRSSSNLVLASRDSGLAAIAGFLCKQLQVESDERVLTLLIALLPCVAVAIADNSKQQQQHQTDDAMDTSSEGTSPIAPSTREACFRALLDCAATQHAADQHELASSQATSSSSSSREPMHMKGSTPRPSAAVKVALLKALVAIFPPNSTSPTDTQLDEALEWALLWINSRHHLVRRHALLVLAHLHPISDAKDATPQRLCHFFLTDDDPRVRACAMQCLILLHGRGAALSLMLYPSVCSLLVDDDEGVRENAVRLIAVLGRAFVNAAIPASQSLLLHGASNAGAASHDSDSQEQPTVRFADDVFARLGNMVNDASMKVRACACALLGECRNVTSTLLLQTFDKKLMAHQKSKGSLRSELSKTKKTGSKRKAAIAAYAAEREAEHEAKRQGQRRMRAPRDHSGAWNSNAPAANSASVPHVAAAAAAAAAAAGVPANSVADGHPKEEAGLVDPTDIRLVDSGACGAFVHALEDEFLEVRSAAVMAICALAVSAQASQVGKSDGTREDENDANEEEDESEEEEEEEDAETEFSTASSTFNSTKGGVRQTSTIAVRNLFAHAAVDFLVDMVNDEIDTVRLGAISSLHRLSGTVVLGETQLEAVLGVLHDASPVVRAAVHNLVACTLVADAACVLMVVTSLIANLKRHSETDRHTIWKCLAAVGRSHAALAEPLVPGLLRMDPSFATAEPVIDDPAYVSVLAFISNAAMSQINGASSSGAVLDMLPHHTRRHCDFLSATHGDALFPRLPNDLTCSISVVDQALRAPREDAFSKATSSIWFGATAKSTRIGNSEPVALGAWPLAGPLSLLIRVGSSQDRRLQQGNLQMCATQLAAIVRRESAWTGHACLFQSVVDALLSLTKLVGPDSPAAPVASAAAAAPAVREAVDVSWKQPPSVVKKPAGRPSVDTRQRQGRGSFGRSLPLESKQADVSVGAALSVLSAADQLSLRFHADNHVEEHISVVASLLRAAALVHLFVTTVLERLSASGSSLSIVVSDLHDGPAGTVPHWVIDATFALLGEIVDTLNQAPLLQSKSVARVVVLIEKHTAPSQSSFPPPPVGILLRNVASELASKHAVAELCTAVWQSVEQLSKHVRHQPATAIARRTAALLSPVENTHERPFEFNPAFPIELPVVADVSHDALSFGRIGIQITFPDGSCKLHVPLASDFSQQSGSSAGRLSTSLAFTQPAWSDPFALKIRIVRLHPSDEQTLARRGACVDLFRFALSTHHAVTTGEDGLSLYASGASVLSPVTQLTASSATRPSL
ncbi:integrator complex subunit 4 [Capsaspora owczarzaki ATCC 30864]|uniref:Integrator complex subunit 4 n=1 Tax=Capsaspora owczarzaki (strain ATCC 30864) TaxID=595528 RepID=A0A0D2VQW5_CAPO3|nr:integrator complex subunit 4 [Capsaspora owczarzaki ATCC 30864]KJE93152.1 integrator complex subunit 4 [Capsaspora owczarzaki ATCC 30864]|eukprot:XP_004347806.2 integrator complex subunit 4 [Capsaspora owczarzaki ATCC 30864]